jgi:hypothetical protein
MFSSKYNKSVTSSFFEAQSFLSRSLVNICI